MKKQVQIIVTLALVLSMLLSAAPLSAVAEERPKITVTIYDRGKVPASEGTIEENRWTRWINENGPVDVEFVAIPRTNSGDKLYVLFASGTAPDLVFEYSPAVRSTLYQQGQLMPLSEALEKYSTTYKERAEKYPNILAAGLMDDGELYGLGKINTSNFTRCVLIRQDWLDNLGLEIPQTLEELRNVCRAFCEDDPDGNGQKDTYAMAMSYGVRYMPTLTNPAQITCFVNASTKNLEAVLQYVDFACSKEFAMAFTYGLEGEHYEMVDGMPVITDTEKFAAEVGWAGDFSMLKSAETLAEYQSTTEGFDLSNPIEAEAYQLRKDALALYLNPELKYPGLTHSEHMPQLPEDLSMINANINLNQFYDRAVVGGTDYTVEMAMEDAKNTWTQGGGDQIMAWWQEWYANDRDNAFLAEDMYGLRQNGSAG